MWTGVEFGAAIALGVAGLFGLHRWRRARAVRTLRAVEHAAATRETVPPPPPAPPPSIVLRLDPQLAGLRILVADDNALVRELFAEVLRSQGAAVETVGQGTAALAVCTERRPDALVLDWHLPGVAGPEVAQSVRAFERLECLAPMRIVAVSARRVNAIDARCAGADAFLPKPVSLGRLIEVVAPERVPDGAGPPPALSDCPTPSQPEAACIQRVLREQFLRDIAAQLERLHVASAPSHYLELERIAHHLLNSADTIAAAFHRPETIADAHALRSACSALESWARRCLPGNEGAELAAHVARTARALARGLEAA